MVPDQKRIFLKMIYPEGQVDYYDRKGTILLGITEIIWKFDGEVSGFKCNCERSHKKTALSV